MNDLHLMFKENGFAFLPNFLPKSQILSLQEQVKYLCPQFEQTTPFKWNFKDGLSQTESLWPLLTDKRIIDAIQEILKEPIIKYAEHSNIKVWRDQKASGWHRDCVDTRYGHGPDWIEKDQYKILRVAIYLQPSHNEFKWGGISGSHQFELPMTKVEQDVWKKRLQTPDMQIGSRLPYLSSSNGYLWVRTSASKLAPPAQQFWINTFPGDVVVFDPRLIHVGGDVMNRKMALLFSYGSDSFLSKRHAIHHSGEWLLQKDEPINQKFKMYLKQNSLWLNS